MPDSSGTGPGSCRHRPSPDPSPSRSTCRSPGRRPAWPLFPARDSPSTRQLAAELQFEVDLRVVDQLAGRDPEPRFIVSVWPGRRSGRTAGRCPRRAAAPRSRRRRSPGTASVRVAPRTIRGPLAGDSVQPARRPPRSTAVPRRADTRRRGSALEPQAVLRPERRAEHAAVGQRAGRGRRCAARDGRRQDQCERERSQRSWPQLRGASIWAIGTASIGRAVSWALPFLSAEPSGCAGEDTVRGVGHGCNRRNPNDRYDRSTSQARHVGRTRDRGRWLDGPESPDQQDGPRDGPRGSAGTARSRRA